MASHWKKSPSELYFIRDELAAFNFNRAVYYFGTSVEEEMRRSSEKAKNSKTARAKAQAVLARWLNDPETPSKAGFRDPVRSQ